MNKSPSKSGTMRLVEAVIAYRRARENPEHTRGVKVPVDPSLWLEVCDALDVLTVEGAE